MNKQQLIDSLRKEGFSNEIARAFEKVKREDFIPTLYKEHAYFDEPQSIGYGQTISQPYTIAFMLDLLELDKLDKNNDKNSIKENIKSMRSEKKQQGDDRNKSAQANVINIKRDLSVNSIDKSINKFKILEVGSGSGYVLTLIHELTFELVTDIFGIERIKKLAKRSKEVLKNYKNIKIINSDGTKGLVEEAPFDRILVSAAADKIPEKLLEQLKEGGILVIPVGNSIYKIIKNSKGFLKKEYYGFVFVPLIED